MKWDCTKDNRCTNNNEYPERIDDTVILSFNVYYSAINAAVKNMTLAGSVEYDAGKLYTDDYDFVIDELSPDTTYYIWVSAVIGDDQNQVVLKDNSSVRVLKTKTLQSAQVTNLSSQPLDIDSIQIKWNDPYSGNNTVSDPIRGYNVYWSESEITIYNLGDCEYKSTDTCSVSIAGLDATTYYYVAVVPIMRDPVIDLNTYAIAYARASLELSAAGGRLVPVDLDNDGVEEAMLCTLTFGNTGQIKGQSQAMLNSLVDMYLTKTNSNYYSKRLYKLIKEDGLTFRLLTNTQIDKLISQGNNIDFIGENLEVGSTVNLAYSDTTYTNGGGTCSVCNYTATVYRGSQIYLDTSSMSLCTNNWNGQSGCGHYGMVKGFVGSAKSTKVGLAGYFLISDMQ